jgi:hypothetical protein
MHLFEINWFLVFLIMSKFSYSDGVAVWRLIFYTFALVCSILVSWRHGFGKNSGWIYLSLFSALRIINSSAELATLSPSDNSKVESVAVITSFMGLSLLLLAALGLLSRMCVCFVMVKAQANSPDTRWYSILQTPWNFIFSFVVLKIVQTPAGIALVLCIIGATSTNTPKDVDKQTTVQAGIAIYLVVYILLVLLTAGAGLAYRMTGRGEKKLLIIVALSLPILLVRVIYSMLSVFSHDNSFNPMTGSTTAQLFLSVIEEMIIVLMYIWAGLTIKNESESDVKHSAESRLMHRAGRGDFSGGKLGILSLGVAAFDEVWLHRKKNEEGPQQGLARLEFAC